MSDPIRKAARRSHTTPYPFEPSGGVSLTCSTSTSRVALSGSGEQVLITNLSTSNNASIVFGDATVEAALSRMVIPYATQVLLTIPFTSESGATKATYVAGITESGTAALQIETGWGV